MRNSKSEHAIIGHDAGNPARVILEKVNSMRAGKRAWADNHYGYPFRQNDGGRSNATKKLWGDCGPIALAIATGTSYDGCVAALKEDGELGERGGCFIEWFIHALEWTGRTFHGMTFRRIAFPASKGKVRMRAEEFCKMYPVGRYILRVSRHYIACVDGVVMGEYPIQPDRCIYAAIEVVQAS